MVPYHFVAWCVNRNGELLGPLHFMDDGSDTGSDGSGPEEYNDPEELRDP